MKKAFGSPQATAASHLEQMDAPEVLSKLDVRSNYAYATLVIGRQLLGAAFGEGTYELTLYCDKDGNLS